MQAKNNENIALNRGNRKLPDWYFLSKSFIEFNNIIPDKGAFRSIFWDIAMKERQITDKHCEMTKLKAVNRAMKPLEIRLKQVHLNTTGPWEKATDYISPNSVGNYINDHLILEP